MIDGFDSGVGIACANQQRHASTIFFRSKMNGKIQEKTFVTARECVSSIFTGAVAITVSISMAALIFHGRSTSLMGYGIGTVLCTTIIVNLVLLIGSSHRGIIAAPQSATSVVLAVGLGLLYDHYIIEGDHRNFPMIVANYIFLTSAITGIVLLLAGKYKLGRLARFIPYPIFGGFLAGTGFLVIKASFLFMLGFAFQFNGMTLLFSSRTLMKILPGVLLGLTLFVLSRTRHRLIMVPFVMLLSIFLFYMGFWVLGTSYETASELGIVMQLNSGGGHSLSHAFNSITQVDYSLIMIQKWTFFTIVFVTAVALLLNLSSLELIVKDDIDLDLELKLSGIGNIVSGFCGGVIGYQMLGPSALNHTLGLKTRMPTIIVIGMSLLILFFGHDFLQYLPVPIIGGYLLFIGLSFLYEFLYESWVRLQFAEYLIVVLIFLITVFTGLLAAIAFGIMAAFFIFILNYSKVRIIKSITTGKTHRSNVERSPVEEELLRHAGKRICVYRLTGYLFFGSVYNLYLNVKKRLQENRGEHIEYVILDLKDVQGMDSSAIQSFLKIRQIVDSRGPMNLLFTHLNPVMLNQFVKGAVIPKESNTSVFEDLDRGLEWCENRLLGEKELTKGKLHFFNEVMKEIFDEEEDIIQFKRYLSREIIRKNDILMKKGDISRSLYIVESGQLSVILENSGDASIRFRKIGSGSIIGEMGLFTEKPRTATVISDIESYVYELNQRNLKHMEENCPGIAFRFQKYVVKLLSMRLDRTTKEKETLLESA